MRNADGAKCYVCCAKDAKVDEWVMRMLGFDKYLNDGGRRVAGSDDEPDLT